MELSLVHLQNPAGLETIHLQGEHPSLPRIHPLGGFTPAVADTPQEEVDAPQADVGQALDHSRPMDPADSTPAGPADPADPPGADLAAADTIQAKRSAPGPLCPLDCPVTATLHLPVVLPPPQLASAALLEEAAVASAAP